MIKHNIDTEQYLFFVKALVYTKNENSVIKYSPSCHSKPIRLSFIFETQMKIFLMKSESFLFLHWQLRDYHIDVSKRDRKMNPLWIEWFSPNFWRDTDRFIWWTDWI